MPIFDVKWLNSSKKRAPQAQKLTPPQNELLNLANNYNKNYNLQSQCPTKMMNKGLIILAIGSIVVAAYSFFKLSQQNKNKPTPKSDKKDKIKSDAQVQQANTSVGQSGVEGAQNEGTEEDKQDRELYDSDIIETHPYKIILKKPILNPDIDQLHYNILLSLNKSKGYEGVVKMRIISNKNALNKKNIYIDSIATTILYLSVNRKRISDEEIIFRNHQILIKKEWLHKTENNIEIIFANKYAFMGDGLTCYFPLDQFNKYSLKGQVIYVRNGFYKVARIFPCLNILNPCEVSLQVLHPNGFSTESNNHKIEMKIATKKDYPRYEFLFYASNKAMNNSYRLNTSALTESNSFRSSDEIVKAKSQFSTARLNTIHDFFLFSSAIVEVRPTATINLSSSATSSFSNSSDQAMKDILIRYFVKQHLVKKATAFLNILQSQIVEIFSKIDVYKKTHRVPLKYQCKIDIFFIDDLRAEGDFYSGSILLNESTIQRGVIQRRLYFLLCRAFIGMGMLMKKHDVLLTLEGMLKMNELTLEIFPECCDFLYVKNKEYENVRNYTMNLLKMDEQNRVTNKIFLSEEEEKEVQLQYWILEYFEKQCRYFLKNLDKFEPQISNNVRNVLENLEKMEPEEYWTFFIARYPFIEFNVSQVLIKISLHYKGVPTGEAELRYAKQNFIKSKYYIKFFTKDEIQNDLKRFIALGTHGIEKILPFIKIKQSFLSVIPQNLEGYLYAKQNRLDSKKLYEQFKKYNEGNNFHHISALRRQIKRIKLLARDNIEFVRRDIHCGLMGWKLLQKLNIHPQDEDTFQLIAKLENVKGSKPIAKREEQEGNAEQEARKLEKLLSEEGLEK